MMKIAMIGLKGIPATYGGVERHVEELSARLAAKGHEVTVYCRRHYTPRHTISHRGVQVKSLLSIHTKHLDAISGTALAVGHALLRRFDVIHFHAIGPALLSFVPRLMPCKRCAVIATVHSQDWRRRKWGAFAKWCLRRGEWAAVRFPLRTIVVSEQLQKHFAEQGRPVVHIPNGVETPTPRPLKELKRFGVRENRYLLWIGRFVPEKRVEDLISAFRQTDGDWRLLLAGELDENDPYVRQLKSQASSDERIIFTGGIYGRAKCEAFTHAALVVQPSELEGFPITLLEAMRYARPVLVSDIEEHLEAVQPGCNGFVFPVRDAEALAGRMQWILDHPPEADEAGRRAEDTAKEYDWRLIAERTERVYEQALRK